jgi:hypothetical protein
MVLFDAGTYYGINIPSLAGTPAAMYFAGVVYFIVMLSATLSMYFVQKIDPTDPMVYKERELTELGRLTDFDFKSYPMVCVVCKTHVSG